MALTEIAVRSAKAVGKITKLSDGGGLQLWMTPDGAKRWRLAYRFAGDQKVLAIGVYPKIGLKEARIARDEAKRLLASGLDPSEAKKQAKVEKVNSAANTFEVIAAELLEKKRREGKADNTLAKTE
jgi:Arm DNA-binding domain